MFLDIHWVQGYSINVMYVKFASYTSLFFLFSILIVSSAYAANSNVDINISNNGDDSTSSVNVQSSTTDGESHVIIEQNGVKKEYHSTNGEDINVDEGSVKVNINNDSSATVIEEKEVKSETTVDIETDTSEDSVTDIEEEEVEVKEEVVVEDNDSDKATDILKMVVATPFVLISDLNLKLFNL